MSEPEGLEKYGSVEDNYIPLSDPFRNVPRPMHYLFSPRYMNATGDVSYISDDEYSYFIKDLALGKIPAFGSFDYTDRFRSSILGAEDACEFNSSRTIHPHQQLLLMHSQRFFADTSTKGLLVWWQTGVGKLGAIACVLTAACNPSEQMLSAGEGLYKPVLTSHEVGVRNIRQKLVKEALDISPSYRRKSENTRGQQEGKAMVRNFNEDNVKYDYKQIGLEFQEGERKSRVLTNNDRGLQVISRLVKDYFVVACAVAVIDHTYDISVYDPFSLQRMFDQIVGMATTASNKRPIPDKYRAACLRFLKSMRIQMKQFQVYRDNQSAGNQSRKKILMQTEVTHKGSIVQKHLIDVENGNLSRPAISKGLPAKALMNLVLSIFSQTPTVLIFDESHEMFDNAAMTQAGMAYNVGSELYGFSPNQTASEWCYQMLTHFRDYQEESNAKRGRDPDDPSSSQNNAARPRLQAMSGLKPPNKLVFLSATPFKQPDEAVRLACLLGSEVNCNVDAGVEAIKKMSKEAMMARVTCVEATDYTRFPRLMHVSTSSGSDMVGGIEGHYDITVNVETTPLMLVQNYHLNKDRYSVIPTAYELYKKLNEILEGGGELPDKSILKNVARMYYNSQIVKHVGWTRVTANFRKLRENSPAKNDQMAESFYNSLTENEEIERKDRFNPKLEALKDKVVELHDQTKGMDKHAIYVRMKENSDMVVSYLCEKYPDVFERVTAVNYKHGYSPSYNVVSLKDLCNQTEDNERIRIASGRVVPSQFSRPLPDTAAGNNEQSLESRHESDLIKELMIAFGMEFSGKNAISEEFSDGDYFPMTKRMTEMPNRTHSLHRSGRPLIHVFVLTEQQNQAITLHDVRNVHMLQPDYRGYDQLVQLVGRAVRDCSVHKRTPNDPRHVRVYKWMYTAPPREFDNKSALMRKVARDSSLITEKLANTNTEPNKNGFCTRQRGKENKLLNDTLSSENFGPVLECAFEWIRLTLMAKGELSDGTKLQLRGLKFSDHEETLKDALNSLLFVRLTRNDCKHVAFSQLAFNMDPMLRATRKEFYVGQAEIPELRRQVANEDLYKKHAENLKVIHAINPSSRRSKLISDLKDDERHALTRAISLGNYGELFKLTAKKINKNLKNGFSNLASAEWKKHLYAHYYVALGKLIEWMPFKIEAFRTAIDALENFNPLSRLYPARKRTVFGSYPSAQGTIEIIDHDVVRLHAERNPNTKSVAKFLNTLLQNISTTTEFFEPLQRTKKDLEKDGRNTWIRVYLLPRGSELIVPQALTADGNRLEVGDGVIEWFKKLSVVRSLLDFVTMGAQKNPDWFEYGFAGNKDQSHDGMSPLYKIDNPATVYKQFPLMVDNYVQDRRRLYGIENSSNGNWWDGLTTTPLALTTDYENGTDVTSEEGSDQRDSTENDEDDESDDSDEDDESDEDDDEDEDVTAGREAYTNDDWWVNANKAIRRYTVFDVLATYEQMVYRKTVENYKLLDALRSGFREAAYDYILRRTPIQTSSSQTGTLSGETPLSYASIDRPWLRVDDDDELKSRYQGNHTQLLNWFRTQTRGAEPTDGDDGQDEADQNDEGDEEQDYSVIQLDDTEAKAWTKKLKDRTIPEWINDVSYAGFMNGLMKSDVLNQMNMPRVKRDVQSYVGNLLDDPVSVLSRIGRNHEIVDKNRNTLLKFREKYADQEIMINELKYANLTIREQNRRIRTILEKTLENRIFASTKEIDGIKLSDYLQKTIELNAKLNEFDQEISTSPEGDVPMMGSMVSRPRARRQGDGSDLHKLGEMCANKHRGIHGLCLPSNSLGVLAAVDTIRF